MQLRRTRTANVVGASSGQAVERSQSQAPAVPTPPLQVSRGLRPIRRRLQNWQPVGGDGRRVVLEPAGQRLQRIRLPDVVVIEKGDELGAGCDL